MDVLSEYVAGRLALYQSNSPRSKGALATLRRGAGKDLLESPETWEYVLSDIPSELLYNGHETNVTPAERAIYTTLTLYATHMQSSDCNVHTSDRSFGEASRILDWELGSEGVERRFRAVLTSNDIEELSHHMRGIITMMRSSDRQISLDYVRLSKDLYNYQFPEGKHKVMLSWGQDFYKFEKKNDSDNEVE